jgi:hypothetical protein
MRYTIMVKYTYGLTDDRGMPIGNRREVFQIWEDQDGEHSSLEEARREAERHGFVHVLSDDELHEHPVADQYDWSGSLVEQRVTRLSAKYTPMRASAFLLKVHSYKWLAERLGIKADTTYEEILSTARRVRSKAKAEGVWLCEYDLNKFLHRVKDAVREKKDENSERIAPCAILEK